MRRDGSPTMSDLNQPDSRTGLPVARRTVLGGALAVPLAVAASRRAGARATLKPLMTGLASRDGSVPAHEAATGAITAVVAPLNWSDIETSPGHFSAAKLEKALGAAL